jgi:fatty acid desaturase
LAGQNSRERRARAFDPPQEGKAMIAQLIAGVIGIGLLVTFLGIMVWWVKAPPLIIIIVVVIALLIYDFVQTLRFGESGPGR